MRNRRGKGAKKLAVDYSVLISRNNQAFAYAHRRLALRREMAINSADSSNVHPAK